MGLGSGACFGQPYRVTPGPLCLSMYRSGRGVSVHFLQTAQTAPRCSAVMRSPPRRRTGRSR
ncbi:LOW QUALITY PROTEIN: conserved hypothetical protein, partial [Streptomyces sp. SPB78]